MSQWIRFHRYFVFPWCGISTTAWWSQNVSYSALIWFNHFWTEEYKNPTEFSWNQSSFPYFSLLKIMIWIHLIFFECASFYLNLIERLFSLRIHNPKELSWKKTRIEAIVANGVNWIEFRDKCQIQGTKEKLY